MSTQNQPAYSNLGQKLLAGTNTAQKQLQMMSVSGDALAASGLPDVDDIISDYGVPKESGSLDLLHSPHFVCKADGGNVVALRFFLLSAAHSDIGGKVSIYTVTERVTATGVTWQRTYVGQLDLYATGTDADSVDGIADGGPGWQHVEDVAVIDDYALSPGIRVIGNAPGGSALVIFDFIGEGWIEVYGDKTAGTLGANDSSGVAGEFRVI